MSSPAIYRLRRLMLEQWIEQAIALLDQIDGDPDLEDGDDDFTDERENPERMMEGKDYEPASQFIRRGSCLPPSPWLQCLRAGKAGTGRVQVLIVRNGCCRSAFACGSVSQSDYRLCVPRNYRQEDAPGDTGLYIERTSIRSRWCSVASTAVKARRLLEQHGYLIPVSRRNGITVYRIENPHHERVQMQIQELEECQREIKTEKNVRNKPQSSMANNAHLDRTGVAENAHPENRQDGNNCPPRMAESADQGGQKMPPITLKEYLTGLPVKEGYEESDGSPVMGDAKETVSETPNEPARTGSDFPANKKNGYALAANGDDENTTFSAPASIQEADDFLLALFGSDLSRLHERVLDGCRKRLMNGLLTPAFVRARIDALEKSQPSLGGASHVR